MIVVKQLMCCDCIVIIIISQLPCHFCPSPHLFAVFCLLLRLKTLWGRDHACVSYVLGYHPTQRILGPSHCCGARK